MLITQIAIFSRALATSDFIKGMGYTFQWTKRPVVEVVGSPYRRHFFKSWKSSFQGSREGICHCLVLGWDNIYAPSNSEFLYMLFLLRIPKLSKLLNFKDRLIPLERGNFIQPLHSHKWISLVEMSDKTISGNAMKMHNWLNEQFHVIVRR